MFRYKQMFLGLKNFFETFQPDMDNILAAVRWQQALVIFGQCGLVATTVAAN